MSAAEKLSPEPSALLTWAEICEQYPDQWVRLVDMEYDSPNSFAPIHARVIGNGETQLVCGATATPLREPHRDVHTGILEVRLSSRGLKFK